MKKLESKFFNFAKAISILKEAVIEYEKENSTDVVRDGLIQRFEFTYELSWKTTKEYLEDLGIVDKNSPKTVFKEAYAQKLITNEDIWMLMINDRNRTSHIYSEDIALEIAERITEKYIFEFELLLERLDNHK